MINKKIKYLIQSLLIGIFLFLFSLHTKYGVLYISAALLIVIVGNIFAHSDNKPKILDTFYISLLSIHLVLGSVLTLFYFPNLSLMFKAIFILGISFLNYIIALVNNIFLVVRSREETIPLYRVALTWSKIVVVVLSIPFFAGVFKLPANTFIQSLITGISAELFCLYIIWSMRFENDAKKFGRGEAIYLSIIGATFVSISNLVVTFMPTESFLRALFVASVLMFIVNYLYAHFKNAITRKLLTEHISISLLFLILLIVFKP